MAKLSDKAEELLETLWIRLGEGGASATNAAELPALNGDATLHDLEARGLISLDAGRLTLTAAGRQEGIAAVRRHRLAERLLADVLDVRGQAMDEAACGFEHSLSSGVEEATCTVLGHPRVCPHGNPIPEGNCCRQQRHVVSRAIAPLAEMQARQGGRIAYIHTADARKLQKLMAMGVLPGREIRLLQRFPSYVFAVGQSQFAVDEEIARTIFVRLEDH